MPLKREKNKQEAEINGSQTKSESDVKQPFSQLNHEMLSFILRK